MAALSETSADFFSSNSRKISQTRRLAAFFLIVVLTFSSEMGRAVLYNNDRFGGPQIEAFRTIYAIGRFAASGLVILLFLYLRPQHVRIPFTLLIFCAYCLVSIVWSQYPISTLQRAAEAVIILTAVAVAVRELGLSASLDAIFRYFAIAIGLGVLVSLLAPEIGVHGISDMTDLSLVGSWRGAYIHKNIFAPVVLLAIGMVWSRVALPKLALLPRLVLLAVMLFVLVKVASATSLAALPVYAGTYFLARRMSRGWAVMTTILVAVTIWFVIANYEREILGLLGRSTTFSGRTYIWALWMRMAGDYPLFGHGFGVSTQDEIRQFSIRALFPSAVHAHSGYIDMYFNLGLVGTILFVAVCFHAAIRSLKILPARNNMAAYLYSSIIAMMFLALADVTVFGFSSQHGALFVAFLLLALNASGPTGPAAQSGTIRR